VACPLEGCYLFLMPIETLISTLYPYSAGQLGRKLREWNMYKYDSKHRPMDLDKPFSDDTTTIEETLSVAWHEVNPRDPHSEYLPAVSTATTHLSMEYNSTGPITVTEPPVMPSPSGNIPSEYERGSMDTDIDGISITSLASSSISGFASLRSLARRIRMDRVTKASSEDQSRIDVPSSAMQWDTSSKNSLRLFGRFSMSSLSVASSRRTDTSTSQMSWRPETKSSTIEEDDGYYTAEYQRKRTLPRLRPAFQDTLSVHRGPDEEYYIPMTVFVQRVQGHEMRDLTRVGYGRLDPSMKVDAVWERFLEESDYKYVRKTSTGFITTSWLGGVGLQPVGKISMQWHITGKDDQVHITDFVIIPKSVPVDSDFVLGLGTLNLPR
jgi:hypothetical protein